MSANEGAPKSHWAQGNEALRRRDYDEALQHYRKAKDITPELARFIDSNIQLVELRRGSHSTLPVAAIPSAQAVSVDIIVPVFNALGDVKACLHSLVAHTDGFAIRVIVVNDASDTATTEWLRDFCRGQSRLKLIEHPENRGYTRAVNTGLRASNAELVVTQNSDTIVSAGWLKRMVACMYSSPHIGIVGPLSNAAMWQNVPFLRDADGKFAFNDLPAGLTVEAMAALVARCSQRAYPRAPFVNGFCFMIRRAVIDAIGHMDEESFPVGYGEEQDFCIRAIDAGFELAIADDAFVFHAKSKSFGQERRKLLSKKGTENLKHKHTRDKYMSYVEAANNSEALSAVRARVGAAVRKSSVRPVTSDGITQRIASLVVRPSPPRIVVYTCLYGRYESLKEPGVVDPAVRYIAFTDDPSLRSERWEICVLHDRLGDSRRSSRLAKILPHLYLPEHEVSIYIDASLQLKTDDINRMVEECLEGRDVALYKHHRRDCIYQEIDICESLSIERPDLIAFYRSHYASLGIGEHAGLYENTLIVRRNTADARKLNEAWWRVYLGQRDQLSLMSAIRTTGTDVNAIRHGRQVRVNDYVSFVKHERPALAQNKPKVYVFIAYAPPGYGQDLGRTYNDYMNAIEDDAYALFLDHDAMFTTPSWFELVERLVVGHVGKECLFIGRTNRIGNPYQRVGVLADDHRASSHAVLAEYLKEVNRDWTVNVAQLNSSSGVILLLSKNTWRNVPFSRGFLKVDNRMHMDFRKSGRAVLMPLALYAYHFYRADGDTSHAVRLDQHVSQQPVVIESEAQHLIKNFVYDEAAGLTMGHYSNLLGRGEWAIFIRADAMFCDKNWYPRAYRRLEQLKSDDVVLFSNNAVDLHAPTTDDILEHRRYASSQLVNETLQRDAQRGVSKSDLVAFMVSGEVLSRAPSGATMEEFADFLSANAREIYRDKSTHVFCQAGANHGSTPQVSAQGLEIALTRQRRVAILTLGFWPNQAGMELMIHNLATHLTNAGDLVTLFAPKPSKAFEEIPHNYLLKRFKDEQDFSRLFALQHAVLPFDVILVQGALEAASMALRMKDEFGVPVVLRTHGEDIQIDDTTGYGYRRDPGKREVIDRNIRRVDRNIVIGEHIAPIVKEIAPAAIVDTIHNGVDVERFRPQRSNFLRERLGLRDDQPVLLTVGRNVKKKAFHLAIEALSLVVKQVPNAALVHVGKDGNGANLVEVAESLGLSKAFYRFGELNYFETPLAYASADLFVFPSKVETFGNVTIEALSSGLPCVEFDYSVNRQKIASGRNGYIVPFGDVEQLAARIVELLQDDAKRAAFGEEARRCAIETFSWTHTASRYRSVFEGFQARTTVRPGPASGFGGPPPMRV